MGKSTFAAKDPGTVDLDSSAYTHCWGEYGERVRNPNFPKNYIEHIKEKMHTVPVICVSIHREIIEYLVNENMVFTVVYPNKSLKEQYIERCISRGSPRALIRAINDNWDVWIKNLETLPCEKLELQSGEFLDARTVEFLVKLKKLRDYQVSMDIEPGGRSEPIKGVPEFF